MPVPEHAQIVMTQRNSDNTMASNSVLHQKCWPRGIGANCILLHCRKLTAHDTEQQSNQALESSPEPMYGSTLLRMG